LEKEKVKLKVGFRMFQTKVRHPSPTMAIARRPLVSRRNLDALGLSREICVGQNSSPLHSKVRDPKTAQSAVLMFGI
jgi:hypothetical protein